MSESSPNSGLDSTKPDQLQGQGKALRWILQHTGQRDGYPFYFGDDLTDETALVELAGSGLGSSSPRPRAPLPLAKLRNGDEAVESLGGLLSQAQGQK